MLWQKVTSGGVQPMSSWKLGRGMSHYCFVLLGRLVHSAWHCVCACQVFMHSQYIMCPHLAGTTMLQLGELRNRPTAHRKPLMSVPAPGVDGALEVFYEHGSPGTDDAWLKAESGPRKAGGSCEAVGQHDCACEKTHEETQMMEKLPRRMTMHWQR